MLNNAKKIDCNLKNKTERMKINFSFCLVKSGYCCNFVLIFRMNEQLLQY